MQSTGHSSTHALSLRSTQGWAITYVTGSPSLEARWPHLVSANAGRCRLLGVTGVSFVPDLALTQLDVGARVTVRRRLDSGQLADVTGDLESLDADRLAIRGRDGDPVVIEVGAVV